MSHPLHGSSPAASTVALVLVVLAGITRPVSGQLRPSFCSGVVGNLVTNCGFETGDLTGWTVPTPPNNAMGVASGNADTGLWGRFLNQVGGFATAGGYGAIRQTLATTAGQTYTISFFGATNAPGQNNGLRLLFGGASVFTQALQTTAYQQYTATGVAGGLSTIFEVQGYNDPARDFVDDFVDEVVVTAAVASTTAPEPATWTLMGTGLVALGVAGRRRRGTEARGRVLRPARCRSPFHPFTLLHLRRAL